jgi:hypothetical protein
MGLKAELAPDAFMHDCDEETVTGALERLTRQPLAVFGQGARAMAWREKPSTYVVCAEDRATSPGDATRVCQEGGPRGRATDRTPPHALASRGAGAGDRGGGQAGRVRNRSLGSDHTTGCRAHDSLPGASYTRLRRTIHTESRSIVTAEQDAAAWTLRLVLTVDSRSPLSRGQASRE